MTGTDPRRLSLIEEIACQIGAALIVIDPIMAFLGVDANGDQKVRGALTPLKSFAEKSGSRCRAGASPEQDEAGYTPSIEVLEVSGSSQLRGRLC